MPVIFYETSNKEIEVPEDSNILRTSLRYDADLPNRCGGGNCGTCMCKIEKGAENLDKVKKAEYKRLGETLIEKGYRLGCQTFVQGDVSVSWDYEYTKQIKKEHNKRKREEMSRKISNS
jgi:ferredoxin